MEFAIRTETCGWCGGRFNAGGAEANVASAIRVHQATPAHQAARARIEGEASHGNDETGS